MKDKHERVTELLQPVLDCFSGADGAVAFARLKMFLEHNIDNEEYSEVIDVISNIVQNFQ